MIHESLEVWQIRQSDHLSPRLVCQPLAGRVGERVVQGDATGQQETPVAVVDLVPAVTSQQHNKTQQVRELQYGWIELIEIIAV